MPPNNPQAYGLGTPPPLPALRAPGGMASDMAAEAQNFVQTLMGLRQQEEQRAFKQAQMELQRRAQERLETQGAEELALRRQRLEQRAEEGAADRELRRDLAGQQAELEREIAAREERVQKMLQQMKNASAERQLELRRQIQAEMEAYRGQLERQNLLLEGEMQQQGMMGLFGGGLGAMQPGQQPTVSEGAQQQEDAAQQEGEGAEAAEANEEVDPEIFSITESARQRLESGSIGPLPLLQAIEERFNAATAKEVARRLGIQSVPGMVGSFLDRLGTGGDFEATETGGVM